jgi:hypothetical protein
MTASTLSVINSFNSSAVISAPRDPLLQIEIVCGYVLDDRALVDKRQLSEIFCTIRDTV